MIIGLTGYAQSGKDTLAKILVEKYGYTRIAFADSVRKLAYETNPMIDSVAGEPRFLKAYVDRDGWESAKQNPHIRRVLQNLGLAARTVLGEDVWVISAIRNMPSDDAKVVFTDVRFKNEATMVKLMGGQVWRVERAGVDAVNSHVSEHELDDYPVDMVFSNNGSIEDLDFLLELKFKGVINA